MKILDASDAEALAGLYAAGWDPPEAVRAGVTEILAAIRARGDEALLAYTRRFDFPGAALATLAIEIPNARDAQELVPPEVAEGLRLARSRVAAFHERQLNGDLECVESDGSRSALLARPLSAVGAYVPGGTASYPSSVIMTAVPAKVAGVPRLVVTTPPGGDGRISPAVLFACSLCGVDELYAAGGAQAIGALAFGTASIPRVDKIVGPGNVWVTEAKRQVFGLCGIDGLAGPSEVLVVADAAARPEFVAGELIAQAEHDPLARVAAVSQDRAILERVAALLDGPFASAAGRNEIVARVLAERAYLIHARNRAETLEVIDRFAPEHLSIQTQDPAAWLPDVAHAGAIFLGSETPVAAGDYIAGPSHVLPTSGAARFSSGLRTADFMRTMSVVENSPSRMRADAALLAALANFEGLPAHARTARLREESR